MGERPHGAGHGGANESGAPVKLVVVSDLHLGDGNPATENWRSLQQAAWQNMLGRVSASTGEEAVELVINGDCFDLLQAAPALGERRHSDVATGLAKLEGIVAAHPDWFAALRWFLASPRRTVTFLTGNHDVELALAPLRALVRRATGARAGAVRFCLARVYQPLPDVAIEHGCQTDPWNRIFGLWDQPGRDIATPDALERDDPPEREAQEPREVELPFGSRYHYQVYLPIQRRFPYFDAFLPGLPQAGVVAMLCLYAPDLVAAGVSRARHLFARPEAAVLPDLSTAVQRDPARLYAAVLPFIGALQAEVWERAGVVVGSKEAERMIAYLGGIQAGLAAGELEALRAVFAVPPARRRGMPAEDIDAAEALFALDERARVGLIGHTHVEGKHTLRARNGVHRAFVNTGTWYNRLMRPTPAGVDARLAAWLRDPAGQTAPLGLATVFSYAVVRGGAGEVAWVERW